MPRSIDPADRPDEEVRATSRLDAARGDQRRLERRRDRSRGGPAELATAADLHAADEQVAAREAWVTWLRRGY